MGSIAPRPTAVAVYATSWTFYGSVGRASRDGIGFLPVYLGPTLAALLGAFPGLWPSWAFLVFLASLGLLGPSWVSLTLEPRFF